MGSVGLNDSLDNRSYTLSDLFNIIDSMKKEQLNDSVSFIESTGDFYREDKRRSKKNYLKEIVNTVYNQDNFDVESSNYTDGDQNILINVVQSILPEYRYKTKDTLKMLKNSLMR